MRKFLKKNIDSVSNVIAKFYARHFSGLVDTYTSEVINDEIRKHLKAEKLQLSLGKEITISYPLGVNIGNNLHIGDRAYLETEGGITIGESTYIGPNFSAYTSKSIITSPSSAVITKQYLPIYIGWGVQIGAGVTVMPGIKIGNGSVIDNGSVVDSNIPENSIISNNTILSDNRPINPVNFLDNPTQFKSAFDLEEKLFFVIGTGRSGSHAITKILSQHPDVACFHEPKGQLIRLSTEYEHG
jgi:acetyltransferase-like isoleucine patch superfamily enzyme